MAVKDVPARPHGAEPDSVEFLSWMDRIARRQNIDDQIAAVTVSNVDETYLFQVSSSATRKCTVSQIVALVASSSTLNDQILIQDQKANGSAGNAYTQGAWRTGIMNTTVTDTGSNVVSLASNAFALKAGSYEFEAEINAGNPGTGGASGARARLRNTTDASTVAQGVNAFSDDTLALIGEHDFMLSVRGSFVIAAQKTFELQVYVQTANSTAPTGITTGEVEIYASIWLRRYA